VRARTLRQAAVYGFVGVLNTAIDFCVFLLFARVFEWSLAWANCAAWLISFSSSYLLHSIVTFPESRHFTSSTARIAAYFFVSIFGFCLGTVVLIVSSYVASAVWAKVVSIAAVFFTTFALNKVVVFVSKT
jgi:putative flippase GtrA